MMFYGLLIGFVGGLSSSRIDCNDQLQVNGGLNELTILLRSFAEVEEQEKRCTLTLRMATINIVKSQHITYLKGTYI